MAAPDDFADTLEDALGALSVGGGAPCGHLYDDSDCATSACVECHTGGTPSPLGGNGFASDLPSDTDDAHGKAIDDSPSASSALTFTASSLAQSTDSESLHMSQLPDADTEMTGGEYPASSHNESDPSQSSQIFTSPHDEDDDLQYSIADYTAASEGEALEDALRRLFSASPWDAPWDGCVPFLAGRVALRVRHVVAQPDVSALAGVSRFQFSAEDAPYGRALGLSSLVLVSCASAEVYVTPPTARLLLSAAAAALAGRAAHVLVEYGDGDAFGLGVLPDGRISERLSVEAGAELGRLFTFLPDGITEVPVSDLPIKSAAAASDIVLAVRCGGSSRLFRFPTGSALFPLAGLKPAPPGAGDSLLLSGLAALGGSARPVAARVHLHTVQPVVPIAGAGIRDGALRLPAPLEAPMWLARLQAAAGSTRGILASALRQLHAALIQLEALPSGETLHSAMPIAGILPQGDAPAVDLKVVDSSGTIGVLDGAAHALVARLVHADVDGPPRLYALAYHVLGPVWRAACAALADHLKRDSEADSSTGDDAIAEEDCPVSDGSAESMRCVDAPTPDSLNGGTPETVAIGEEPLFSETCTSTSLHRDFARLDELLSQTTEAFPSGRLRPLGDETLIDHSDGLYVPETVEIHRGAVAQLRSDMAAFRAANPRAAFPDFVRWHSPRDWVAEGENHDCPGALSARMAPHECAWQHLWRSSVPRSARCQRVHGEIESLLQFISTAAPVSLVLRTLLAAGIAQVCAVLSLSISGKTPIADALDAIEDAETRSALRHVAQTLLATDLDALVADQAAVLADDAPRRAAARLLATAGRPGHAGGASADVSVESLVREAHLVSASGHALFVRAAALDRGDVSIRHPLL